MCRLICKSFSFYDSNSKLTKFTKNSDFLLYKPIITPMVWLKETKSTCGVSRYCSFGPRSLKVNPSIEVRASSSLDKIVILKGYATTCILPNVHFIYLLIHFFSPLSHLQDLDSSRYPNRHTCVGSPPHSVILSGWTLPFTVRGTFWALNSLKSSNCVISTLSFSKSERKGTTYLGSSCKTETFVYMGLLTFPPLTAFSHLSLRWQEG